MPQEKIRLACINFIQNDDLIFHKINMISITAIRGNLWSIRHAFGKFDHLLLQDRKTLIETCMELNDIDCMNVIIERMRKSSYTLTLDTSIILMHQPQTDSVKAVLEGLIKPAVIND